MDLEKLKKEAEQSIATLRNAEELEAWRIKYLGRKSFLSLFFNSLSRMPLAEKRKNGERANACRQFLNSLYQDRWDGMKKKSDFSESFTDITRPGEKIKQGHLNPLTLTLREITDSFQKMGFSLLEGPEIEAEYYNFEALNMPPGHPAREMWDTLWLRQDARSASRFLLRTHTSPMQMRYMEKHTPPFRIIVPGKCFRYEAVDVSHDIQFHQVEGLMVGENISLANFKAMIEEVVKDIFHDEVLVRFRPSYFPFVSPGVEVDIKLKSSPSRAKQKKSQGYSQWLEIMGAGMVHPNLFKRVGYAPQRWQGFAFGLGVERIAMIKYRIGDIRLFAAADIRFLKQF